MPKSKKTKMTDEEALQHYVPCDPPEGGDSKPEFIKAVLAIDRTIAKRKTPVIKTKQRNTKWRKSPTKKH
jgi:hypothetical protein